MNRPLPLVLAVVLFLAIASPVDATLIGDTATVTFSNFLVSLTISDLVANRLVVRAAGYTDRLFLETSGRFVDPDGRLIAEMLPEASAVLQETAAGLRWGPVTLDPIVRAIDQTFIAPEIAAVLNSGQSVTYELRVTLVLLSRGGRRYFLDSTTLGGVIVPATIQPSIAPTFGGPGSPFIITDPVGRMAPGDMVIFYEAGTGPELGVAAPVISGTSTTIEATVPGGIGAGVYQVTVRENVAAPPRFVDLVFRVD